MVTVRELARSQGFPDHFVFYAADGDVKTVSHSSFLDTAGSTFTHFLHAASSTDRQCSSMAYWICSRPSGFGSCLCDMERQQARCPHHRGGQRLAYIVLYWLKSTACSVYHHNGLYNARNHVLLGSFHQAPPHKQRCVLCRVQARHLIELVRVLGSPRLTSDLPSQHTQRELRAGWSNSPLETTSLCLSLRCWSTTERRATPSTRLPGLMKSRALLTPPLLAIFSTAPRTKGMRDSRGIPPSNVCWSSVSVDE